MAKGLSVSRLINVTINLGPRAATRRNFGVLCIAGPSDVITAQERIRFYTGTDGIAEEFGLDAPEYKAAEVFFSQSPRPSIVAVARWLKSASSAVLRGGILTAAEQLMGAWTSITDGAFTLTVGGAAHTVSGLDFSGQTNLNGVASVIRDALAPAGATIAWDGGRFTAQTLSGGTAAALGWASAPTGDAPGTDIAAMLKLTAATALTPEPGRDPESPAECAAALADLTSGWYGLTFADQALTDEQHLAVAAAVEAMDTARLYALTITDTRALDAAHEGLPAALKAAKYKRTFWQYSDNPYAVASGIGRAFTVNFGGNRTAITLMYKQEPGVVPQYLTETQARVLEAKNGNVFAYYDNDTAILQPGVMASGDFFDEIHGLDWLADAVQTACYNLEYTSSTKISQTDEGLTEFVNVIEAQFVQARNNGLIAPGTWNQDGFGQLKRGDYLPKGWYIYAPPMDSQDQSEREQRKAPPIQCAIKLAGAIHTADVLINVNR